MKKALLGFVVLLATVLLPASPASAASSGNYNPPPTVTMLDGCFYIGYSAQFVLDPAVDHWNLDTRVLYPNGTVFDIAFDYGTGAGAPLLPEEMFFCDSFDPLGTYTITGFITTNDYDDATYGADVVTQMPPATFQVVAPAAPPPPQPLPPTPVGDTKVKTLTRIVDLGEPYTLHEQFFFRVKVREAEASPARKVYVRPEYKNSFGTWVRLDRERVQLNQWVKIGPYTFDSRSSLKVRLKALPGDYTLRSTSDVITLRAARVATTQRADGLTG